MGLKLTQNGSLDDLCLLGQPAGVLTRKCKFSDVFTIFKTSLKEISVLKLSAIIIETWKGL